MKTANEIALAIADFEEKEAKYTDFAQAAKSFRYETDVGIHENKTYRLAYIKDGDVKWGYPNPSLLCDELPGYVIIDRNVLSNMAIEKTGINPGHDLYNKTEFVRDMIKQSIDENGFQQRMGAIGSSLAYRMRELGINQLQESIARDVIELALSGEVVPCPIPDEIMLKMGEIALSTHGYVPPSESPVNALLSVYGDTLYRVSLEDTAKRVFEGHKESIAQELMPSMDSDFESLSKQDKREFLGQIKAIQIKAIEEGRPVVELYKEKALRQIIDQGFPNIDDDLISTLEMKSVKDFINEVQILTLKDMDQVQDACLDVLLSSDVSFNALNSFIESNYKEILSGRRELIEFPIALLGDKKYTDDAYFTSQISEYDLDDWQTLSHMLKVINCDGVDLYNKLIENYDLEDPEGLIKKALSFTPMTGSVTPSDRVLTVLEESNGGFPVLWTFVDSQELLDIDLSKPINLQGNMQFGLHDNISGSGFVEEVGPSDITIYDDLLHSDNTQLGFSRYSVQDVFDFVEESMKSYVEQAHGIELSLIKEQMVGMKERGCDGTPEFRSVVRLVNELESQLSVTADMSN